MKRLLQSCVLSCLLAQGCAPGIEAEPSTYAQLEAQLNAISTALAASDLQAFKKTLAPEYLARLEAQSSNVDAELVELMSHQRASWLRLIGDGTVSAPIDQIVEGRDGDVAVSFLGEEAAGKSIHFLAANGVLGFTGPDNLRPEVSSLAAAGAVTFERWNFHFKNWSRLSMSVCVQREPNTCPSSGSFDCSGINIAGFGGRDWTEKLDCQLGHVGSCGIGVRNEDGTVCLRSGGCWYQWIGVDVWRGSDNVYGCGG